MRSYECARARVRKAVLRALNANLEYRNENYEVQFANTNWFEVTLRLVAVIQEGRVLANLQLWILKRRQYYAANWGGASKPHRSNSDMWLTNEIRWYMCRGGWGCV